MRVCLVFCLCLCGLVSSSQSFAADEKDSKFVIGKTPQRITGFRDWTSASAFSPDGKWLAIGGYQDVRLFAVENGKVDTSYKFKLKNKSGYVQSFAFVPGQNLLAVGSYQTVELVSLDDGKVTKTIKAHRGIVTDIVYFKEGEKVVTSSDDELVIIWNAKDWSPEHKITSHRLPVYGVAISPDESVLATVTGDEFRITQPGRIRLFDLKTAELKHTLEEHQKQATDVAFSIDGKYLITTSVDEKANVYSVDEAKPLGFFGGHSRPINSIRLLPDGRTAITCSGGRFKGKNEVITWKITSGDEDFKFEPHREIVTSIAVSPDGKLVATTSRDKSAAIWTINEEGIPSEKKPDDKASGSDDIPPAPELPQPADS